MFFPLRKYRVPTHKFLPAWARRQGIFGATVHGRGLGVRESQGGSGSERERGGKDRGCLQCHALLFLSQDRLPILLAGCVPSFLLSLAVEDGLK